MYNNLKVGDTVSFLTAYQNKLTDYNFVINNHSSLSGKYDDDTYGFYYNLNGELGLFSILYGSHAISIKTTDLVKMELMITMVND